jgi:hypothetical protein
MSRRNRRFGLPRSYGRDPFKVSLKATAPHSKHPQQLSLDFASLAKPPPRDARWPEHQIDLEEFIASLPPKEPSP